MMFFLKLHTWLLSEDKWYAKDSKFIFQNLAVNHHFSGTLILPDEITTLRINGVDGDFLLIKYIFREIKTLNISYSDMEVTKILRILVILIACLLLDVSARSRDIKIAKIKKKTRTNRKICRNKNTEAEKQAVLSMYNTTFSKRRGSELTCDDAVVEESTHVVKRRSTGACSMSALEQSAWDSIEVANGISKSDICVTYQYCDEGGALDPDTDTYNMCKECIFAVDFPSSSFASNVYVHSTCEDVSCMSGSAGCIQNLIPHHVNNADGSIAGDMFLQTGCKCQIVNGDMLECYV